VKRKASVGEKESAARWHPDFFERLKVCDPELSAAVDEMLERILWARLSKPPMRFQDTQATTDSSVRQAR
jgi:hypothetical protein